MRHKSTRSRTDAAVADAANGPTTLMPTHSASVPDSDIAHRAYELYLARGCEHGHDVDDWFQAEGELRRLLPPRAW